MSAGAARLRGPAADAGRRHALVLGTVAQEGLADLEQRHVADAAVGVALRRRDQGRQQARPHVREVRRDGIGERELRLAAPEGFRLLARHEGPRHGLDQAAGRKRAPGVARAALDQAEPCARNAGARRQRRRGHAVEPDDPHDLLDQVSLSLDVGPPARNGDLEAVPLAGDPEAQHAERRLDLRRSEIETGEPSHLGDGEVDDQVPLGNGAGRDDLGGLPAAELQHKLGRELEAGQREGRIDAALEAVAGVGIDVQRAARAGDVERVPEGALDQDVGRVLVTAGGGAADDARERLHAVVVGDDAHRLVDRIGLAVEREEAFAAAATAHHEVALHLGGVEHVQRPVAVERHVVGDVHQRVDRLLADRLEASAQPLGRLAVPDPAHQAQGEERRQRLGVAEIEAHSGRAREGARDRLDDGVAQFADLGGREVARDAVDAEAVRPVRRDGDLDHRIVQPHHGREGPADRRVLGQLHDAVMVVAEAELARGAQHAARGDAADLGRAELDAARRDHRAGRGEHHLEALPRVRSAAHHLQRRALADVHHADLELVGVRVPPGLQDVADDEGRQIARLVLDVLDLEPDARQRVGDRLEVGVAAEVLFQPGEGELHDDSPPASVGKSSARNP